MTRHVFSKLSNHNFESSNIKFSVSYTDELIRLYYSTSEVRNLQAALDAGKFKRCSDCECFYNPKTGKYDSTLGDICYRCASKYHTCEICGIRHKNERCLRCYFLCDGCNLWHLKINRPDAYRYSHLCSECYSLYACVACDLHFSSQYELDSHKYDEHSNRVRIRSYSYKPRPNFLKHNSEGTKRFFGVEVEFEFNGESEEGYQCLSDGVAKNTLYLKSDGSLSDGGELVTHPATLEYWTKNNFLKSELDCLQSYGYRSHDTSTCGLHIHVSKNSAKMATWAKTCLFWYTHVSFIAKLCRRQHGHYCHYKDVSLQNSTDQLTYSYDRYEAVNFENDNTVEFRQFKGTLNHDTLLASIELIDCLLKFCAKSKGLNLVKLESIDKFIQYAKDNCTHLYEYIKSKYHTTI